MLCISMEFSCLLTISYFAISRDVVRLFPYILFLGFSHTTDNFSVSHQGARHHFFNPINNFYFFVL